MAKIITQTNLFDYTEIEKLGDLERLDLALEGIDDEKLMERLEAKRKNGRNDYPVRVMWNLLLAMVIFSHKTVDTTGAVKELSASAEMRAFGLRQQKTPRASKPCFQRIHKKSVRGGRGDGGNLSYTGGRTLRADTGVWEKACR